MCKFNSSEGNRNVPVFIGNWKMAHTTIYSNSGLSHDQIRSECPSVFGSGAHFSRSSKYIFVPTSEILEILEANNFVPVSASQTHSRSDYDINYAKHLIRLRHKSMMNGAANGGETLGGVVPELILQNAHNGTSSLKLLSGIFRIACLNGLIMGTGIVGAAIRHMGDDTVDEVKETADKVLKNSLIGIDEAKEWAKVKLEKHARDTIAELAHKLRFADDSQIPVESLLEPRRSADMGHDLWTTFNVVQENIMKGGLSGGGVVNGRWKNSRSSGITAVDKTVELNQKLWDVCAEFA